MPFDSDKQRRYLWSQKPEVAKKIAYKQQGGLTDFDSWTDVAPEQQTHQAALNAALDFTPGIGDVKGLLEAESGLDYGLAALGVLPGGKALKKLPLEELMRKRKELIDEYTFGDEVPEIYVHSSRSPDLDLDTFNYRPVNVPTKAAHGKGAGIFTHGLSDVDNFSDYGDYKYAVVKRPGVSYPGQIDDVDTRGEIFIPQNLVEDIVPLNFNHGGSVPGGDMQVKKMTQKDRYGNQITYEYDLPDQTKLMEKQMDMMVPEMPDIPRQVSSMEMQMGYDHPGEPKGSDTVPAWLTPGEFVVNAEAMRHVPGAKETVEHINNQGRAIQQAQGGSIPQYHNSGGQINSADVLAQLMAQGQIQGVPEYGSMEGNTGLDPSGFQDIGWQSGYTRGDGTMVAPSYHGGDRATTWGRTGFGKETTYGGDGTADQRWQGGGGSGSLRDTFGAATGSSNYPKSGPGSHRYDKTARQLENIKLPDWVVPDSVQIKPNGGITYNINKSKIPEGYEHDYDFGDGGFRLRKIPKTGAGKALRGISDFFGLAEGGSVPQYHNNGGFAGRFYGGIPADIQLAIGDAGVPQAAGAPAPIPQPQAEVPAVAEPPAPQEFDRAGLIDKVLDFEGGFVDKKEDRGGRTNFGITQKTWDAHTDGQGGDVKDLSKDQAKEFYSNLYDQYKLERFPAQIRGKMFDMIVNHGYGNAAKILQRAGGVERDGKIGPATLRAVQGLSVDDLADARQGFYDDIIANDPTQEVFKKGWYSRNDKWRTQQKAMGGPIYRADGDWVPQPNQPGSFWDNFSGAVGKTLRGEGSLRTAIPQIGDALSQVPEGLSNMFAPAAGEVSIDEFGGVEEIPEYQADEGLEEVPTVNETPIFRQTDDSLLQVDTPESQAWAEQTQASEAQKEEAKAQKNLPVDPLIQEAVKEAAKMEKAAGQPQTGPGADQPGPTVDETELQAAAANAAKLDPTFFGQLQQQFMDQFKDIASPENITGMAMRYLGSRALGYSHSGSLGWAAKSQLGEHVQKEQMLSQTAKELAKQAKYTPASIQRFKETGDESVLQAVSTGANIKQTKAKPDTYYNADGKKVQAFEYEDGSGNKYLGDSSGRPIDTGGLHQEPWRVQGTKEWNTRVNQNRKVTTDQLKSLRNQFGVVGKTAEGSNIYGTEINPETQAGEIAKWAAKNNVAPEELAGLVSSAYHNALNEPRQDGKKVRDLTSHLNDLVIRSSVGSPDLFKTETGGFVASDKMAVVNNVIERRLQQAGIEGNVKNVANQYYNDALTDWTALGPEGQKKYNDRANEDENGFYLFIANELGIDSRVK